MLEFENASIAGVYCQVVEELKLLTTVSIGCQNILCVTPLRKHDSNNRGDTGCIMTELVKYIQNAINSVIGP